MRSPKKAVSLGLGLILSSIGVGFLAVKFRSASSSSPTGTVGSQGNSTTNFVTAPKKNGEINRQNHLHSIQSQARLNKDSDRNSSWQEFTRKFGPELKSKTLSDGRIVAIYGSRGKGVHADSDFDPEDSKKAVDRAKEIVLAATDLLALQPDWPLGFEVAKVSPASAHIFLNETYQGLLVRPVGSIKIDLGAKGELVSLYSDYAPYLKIVNAAIANEVRLDVESAKIKALEAIPRKLGEATPVVYSTNSEPKVIWVTGRREGHIAYDFMVDGRQIVVDAQTGKILFQRNQRQF